jgi:type IV secretory pathway VirB10-like protein
MARTPKLKVFCTPIGFHDAYVAAPSRKAALAAWGSDRDLFARGVAEEVLDPERMKEALARPGVVIRRTRGSVEEQIAALPKDTPKPKRAAPAKVKPKTPKPSRAALESAEQALAELRERQEAERADLARREAELARERQAMDAEQAKASAKLERGVEEQRQAYAEAMAQWQG